MGLDLPGGVVPAQAEVLVEQVGAGVEWEVTAPEPVLVGSVSALIVVPGCPIRWEPPATI